MLFRAKRQPVTQDQWVEWIIWTEDQATPASLLEDGVRRIVREELAELVPVEVPDTPPKDL